VDSSDIPGMADCQDYSATFLTMLEQQIAVQADAFIGNSATSITQNIIFERLAANKTTLNYFWESMKC
jgi:hypothetical protein